MSRIWRTPDRRFGGLATEPSPDSGIRIARTSANDVERLSYNVPLSVPITGALRSNFTLVLFSEWLPVGSIALACTRLIPSGKLVTETALVLAVVLHITSVWHVSDCDGADHPATSGDVKLKVLTPRPLSLEEALTAVVA